MNMKSFLIAFALIILNAATYAQDRKVGVVTFYADKTIDLSQVSATADFVAKNTSLSEDPKFNLEAPLKKFHSEFFANYVKNFPFQVVDENSITSNTTYVNYTPGNDNMGVKYEDKLFEKIEGYKVIRPFTPNVKEVAAMANELGVDGIMFVYLYFDFNKTAIGKLGYFSIRAHVAIDLYDKNGKSIFQFNELAGSKKKVPMVGGWPVMDPDKIQPMCEDAVAELMEDMNKKLERLAKKVDRKF